MIGIERLSLACTIFMSSMPSTSGIMMSVRMRSIAWSGETRTSIAFWPFSAVVTARWGRRVGSEWRERGREGQRRGEKSPRVRRRSSSIRGIRIGVLRSRRRRRERVAGNDRARRSTPRARRERATATERGRARTLVSAALEQRLDEDHRRLVVLHEEDVELGLRATALREERGRVRGAILRGIGLRGRRLGGFSRRPRLVSRRHRVRRLAEPRNRLARAPRSRRRSRRAREAGSLRDRRPRGTSASNEPRTTRNAGSERGGRRPLVRARADDATRARSARFPRVPLSVDAARVAAVSSLGSVWPGAMPVAAGVPEARRRRRVGFVA